MLIPFHVDVPMARLPWVNWVLIAVTSLVSLAVLAGWQPRPEPIQPKVVQPKQTKPGPGAKQKPTIEPEVEFFDIGLEREPPLTLRKPGFAWWQLPSHLFVHADFMHLVGNMLFLFLFGNAVNAKLGHVWFLVNYFVLGAIAGTVQWFLTPGGYILGASGAIMGIVGIFLIFFPRNDVQIFYWWGYVWTGTFSLSSGWVIAFYLVCDLVGSVFDGGGGVGYFAHLGGAAAGILVGLTLVGTGLVQSTEYEENLLQVLGWQPKTERTRRRKKRRRPVEPDAEEEGGE